MAFWKQSSFYEKDVSNSAGDCFYTSAVGPTILTVFVQKFGDGLEKKNTALIETKPKKSTRPIPMEKSTPRRVFNDSMKKVERLFSAYFRIGAPLLHD